MIDDWPLYLTKRTLAVLAQALFLRLYGIPPRAAVPPRSDDFMGNSEARGIVTAIWESFISSLVRHAKQCAVSTNKRE